MSKNHKKSALKRAGVATGALSTLAVSTMSMAPAAMAANVDYVVNVQADKSIYDEGKEMSVYTATVENQAKVDGTSDVDFQFHSPINGLYSSDWEITCTDSMGKECKPTITAADDIEAGGGGFKATLPAMEAGEKVTFTIKAPTNGSIKDYLPTAKITAKVSTIGTADTDVHPATNTASVSPQLARNYGDYGVSTTGMVNTDNPDSPVETADTKFHMDTTVTNDGNVDEEITTIMQVGAVFKDGKISCVSGSCDNLQLRDPMTGNWVDLDSYVLTRNVSTASFMVKGKIPAGKKAVIRIEGVTNESCGITDRDVNSFAAIVDASITEAQTMDKVQNNQSSVTKNLQSAVCKVSDVAVENITQEISSDINGIKPYMVKKNDDGSIAKDSNGNATYSSNGEIATFKVTYSNLGTTDVLSMVSGPSLEFPGAVAIPVSSDTKANDGIGNVNYDEKGYYTVVDSTPGVKVNAVDIQRSYGMYGFNESVKSPNTVSIPAGGKVTIEYRYVVLQDPTACVDRTDGTVRDVIYPDYSSSDSNEKNNVNSINVHMIGVPVKTCTGPGGRYDLTGSVQGLYTDAALTTPLTGSLKPGQHVWSKTRHAETSDSQFNVPNPTARTSLSFGSSYAQLIGEAKIVASSDPSIKILGKAPYSTDTYSLSEFKPGDYVELVQEFVVPQTVECVAGGRVDNGTATAYTSGDSTVKDLGEVSYGNNGTDTPISLTIPACSSTLSIEKTANTERMSDDGKGSYTITLKNTGKGDLDIAQFMDTLPMGTQSVNVTSIETTGGAIAPPKESFQVGKDVDENGKVTDRADDSGIKSLGVSWGSLSSPAMPAGSSITIHMDVQADNGNGQFNTAHLSKDSDDPGLFRSVQDDAYIPGFPGQNLSITKKADKPNPKPGEKVTYTVDIANYGAPITKAYLRDVLEAELAKDNPNGYTNVTCRALTEADGVLTGRDAIGAAECPEITSDASGISATVTKMESNSGLRLTYTVNAPTDAVSAPNTASFTSNPTIANLGDAYSQANILTRAIQISGTVWHDADGSAKGTFNSIQNGDEKGTDASGLTAVLVDPAGLVLNTATVNADGTYVMDAPLTTQGLSVALVPTAQAPAKGTAFDAKTQAQLPTEWLGTTPLAHQDITTGYKDVTNVDFGVQQPPNTDSKQTTPQENPGGDKQVQVPTLTGTDPEDGNKGTGDTFRIDTLPKDGVLYYDGKPVTEGQVIENYDPTKLTVDPKGGNVVIEFEVSVQDKAGAWDPTPGKVTMPFTTTPASISGYVYEDVNKDGVKDEGEKAIPGTVVTLTGTDQDGNAVELTTNTDANGYYQFVNLVPGSYSVKETQPASYDDGKDTVGTGAAQAGNADTNDVFASITLNAGDKAVNYNFGELHHPIPGVISGTVYEDDNNDGVKGADEKPIPGTTVTLTGTDNDGNPVNMTTTTDENGNYSFKDVPAGKGYTITETQPEKYLDGKVTPGTGATDNGKAGTNVITGINLDEGQGSTGNNFGELKPASISGTVYDDANKDGKKDASEKGIPGATVTLTGTDKDGKAVSLTTTTDADGNYSFKDLVPGKYTVTETQPEKYDDGKDALGTGASEAGTLENDKAVDVLLNGGDAAVEYNFGENTPEPPPVVVPEEKPASISGVVYEDKNKDGKQDADEKGIPNVSVVLTGTDKDGKAVNVTVITDKDGKYIFDGLKPGTYTVDEKQPKGYDDGKDALGTGATKPGTLSNDKATDVVLSAGDKAVEYNFGENTPEPPPVVVPDKKPASISGHVFEDTNKDGKMDANEKGIPGTTVVLTGTDVDGKTVKLTTVTDKDGKYTFDNLTPGDYTVTETQPKGYDDGKDALGTGASKPGTLGNDTASHVILGEGDKAVDYNFGENKVAEKPTPKPDEPKPTPEKPQPKPSKPTPTPEKPKPVTPGPVIQTDLAGGDSAAGAGLGFLAGVGALGGVAALRRRRK